MVGLYLDPPAGAVVLSVDEKSQVQALDRTAPQGEAARRGGQLRADIAREVAGAAMRLCGILQALIPAVTLFGTEDEVRQAAG
ncbi:hypothetical protein [Micromonospora sp. NPDC000668]|uniref:hypothetical protein n=1 Tax=Micromonospora sp. NPDC000668 TaxID=3364219 RepID=UPI0036C135E3